MPTLAQNKKALFDYEILDDWEAGLVLSGQEVKAVRAGQMSLKGAFVHVKADGVWLVNAHIPKYSKAGPLPGYDPDQSRKLLLHAREIDKIRGKLDTKGLTIVPISAYTKGSRIKIKIGLARGKKQFQKKEVKKQRDIDRDLRRSLK
jgi:SsrA-binding protein